MTAPAPEEPVKRPRLVARGKDDRFAIHRKGNREFKLNDLYVLLLQISWKRLIGIIACVYIAVNLLFAFVYLGLHGSIENAQPGSFADRFFFSVQTLSTIGYGKMDPVGLAANLVVTAEVLTGFIFYAMVTGMVFAKFSRPTARVLFSNVAVICPYDGKPHLMMRMANQRHNRIVDANVHAVLLRKVATDDGHSMRRFYDLTLVRSRMPILQLSWTLMHAIDEDSPFHEATLETLKEWDAEILISLVGLDETFSQTIHTRWSYIIEDIQFDAVFEDVIKRREGDNGIDVDYTKFHSTKPI